MLAFITAIFVSAAPVKVAAPGLKGADVPQDKLDFFSDHLAQQLNRDGLKVVTPAEIKQLISMERQKELLGCADDGSNCMVELSNALGVDGMVMGSIGKFGGAFQIDLKVVSSRQGQALSTYSARVPDEPAVLDELNKAASQMASDVIAALRPAPPRKNLAWIPAAGGAAAVIGGVAMLAVAKSWDGQLTNPTTTLAPDTALSYRNTGPAVQGVGIALVGVGAVALGVAGWMFLSPGGTGVSVSASADRPGILVTGRFP